MLNIIARAAYGRLVAPLGQWLAKVGVTADAITVVGTAGAVGAALGLFTQGYFLAGTFVIWFCVMLDTVDGAVARARGTTSKFGALLDSVSDRVADAAVFAALAWWFAQRGPEHSQPLLVASLLCLVFGAVTSYVKARAEGLGMTCNVGIAERAERLIIVLVGTGLHGLGVPYVLAIALWALVGLTFITVGQRLAEVRRQSVSAPAAAAAPRR